MTLVERVAEWPEQWRQEGHEEQGLEYKRGTIVHPRQAATRFGTEIPAPAGCCWSPSPTLGRLAEVGDRLVRCHTGHKLSFPPRQLPTTTA